MPSTLNRKKKWNLFEFVAVSEYHCEILGRGNFSRHFDSFESIWRDFIIAIDFGLETSNDIIVK